MQKLLAHPLSRTYSEKNKQIAVTLERSRPMRLEADYLTISRHPRSPKRKHMMTRFDWFRSSFFLLFLFCLRLILLNTQRSNRTRVDSFHAHLCKREYTRTISATDFITCRRCYYKKVMYRILSAMCVLYDKYVIWDGVETATADSFGTK